MNKKENMTLQTINFVPTRGIVLLPGEEAVMDIGRKRSIDTLEHCMNEGLSVFFAVQKSDAIENPTPKDIREYGVVGEIVQITKTGKEYPAKVLIKGINRARAIEYKTDEELYSAVIVPEKPERKDKKIRFNEEVQAVARTIKDSFEEFAQYLPNISKKAFNNIISETDPYKLYEQIAFCLPMTVDDKYDLLIEPSFSVRLGIMLTIINRENEILDIQTELADLMQTSVDQGQREFIIREQIRVLREQLGDEEGEDFSEKILALKLDEASEKKLLRENERLVSNHLSQQDAYVIRNYLETVTELPWNVSKEENNDIGNAKAILDADHYGLEKVKDRIIENIAVRQLTDNAKTQIICLSGPPGVGKTSIAKSVAKALGRDYVRISLGGVRDEADIRGHRKTYVGAMPGRIIDAIRQAGSDNPLILLDEIDKVGNSAHGNPSAALLEVLDAEQNSTFRDHYLEVPFSLAKVMFITTANDIGKIDPPLLDRMDVIEMTSYTREEKFNIAVDHLIPKQMEEKGLSSKNFKIADAAVYVLIDNYTKEAGVRKLERKIGSLCRKAAKEIVSGEKKKISVTTRNIEDYLGHRKYLDDEISKKDEVGLVNGLAWTSVGGVMLPMEVMSLEGTGQIKTTGSLGDVMKESAQIAVSYVRSVADKYNITNDFYKTKDIHIHAPEGATPKDGPSAGVTMTTALVSALSGIPVRHDVAMTGEITLHGKVLPIGGLREKTMAAYKEGIRTVIIPKGNKGDLDEVEKIVKDNVDFVFAESLTDVLDTALKMPKKAEPKKRGRKPSASAKAES